MKSKWGLIITLTVVMLFTLAGCGKAEANTETTVETTLATQTTETVATETMATEAVASKLQKIKDKGTLVLGTSADYPPFEFHLEVDGKDTIVGFDIDIAQRHHRLLHSFDVSFDKVHLLFTKTIFFIEFSVDICN